MQSATSFASHPYLNRFELMHIQEFGVESAERHTNSKIDGVSVCPMSTLKAKSKQQKLTDCLYELSQARILPTPFRCSPPFPCGIHRKTYSQFFRKKRKNGFSEGHYD